jgi:phosphatidylglycerol:prolipoprotein diacylglycerol transferase
MIPKLFSIGSFDISPFGVMLVLAFLTAFWQLRRGLRRLDIGDEEDASAVLFAACFGGIIGAKIYYAVLWHDWRLLFSRSGLVWYGGFLLATLAVVFTVRKRRLPAWSTADAAAVGLALGYAIGRIGCFLVGDDYGIPSDLPWAVAFAHGLPVSNAFELRKFGVEVASNIPNQTLLRVHPTQLYETLAALAIWRVGDRALRPGRRAGSVVLLVVGLLAIERFLVEFVRAKDDRFFGGLTLAQVVSLGVLAVAVALWARRRSTAGKAGG